MAESLGHRHKEDNRDDDGRIVALGREERDKDDGAVAGGGGGGGDDFGGVTFHNLKQLGANGLRNIGNGEDDSDDPSVQVSLHKKWSAEQNHKPPTPSPTPRLAGLRGIDEVGGGIFGGTVAGGDRSDGSGGSAMAYIPLHKKSPDELNFSPTTPSPTPKFVGLRGIDENEVGAGGGGATVYVSLHEKSSTEQDYLPPRRSPTPKPTNLVLTSLRDVHQSSDHIEGLGMGHVGTHHKFSQEKNAVNPADLPNYTWETPEPTPSPTAKATSAPTVDIRRVAGAPDTGDYDGADGCRANVDGAYFGDGQSAKDGGMVLRYRYELVQDLPEGSGASEEGEGTELLVQEILPDLEDAMTNALIPLFFKGCSSNAGQVGEERVLLGGVKVELGADRQGRRQRKLNRVVGIESKPVDFPLRQQDCVYDPPDPRDTTIRCHRIEGAISIYFPPNYSLSTLLSSTTPTTLRAIEAGMTDGSLKQSHNDIRRLHFLESSYDLRPIVPGGDEVDMSRGVKSEDEGGSTVGGDGINLGLILGIAIPLLVILCCSCVGVMIWRRHKHEQSVENNGSLQGGEEVSNASGALNGDRHSRRRRRHTSTSDDGSTESCDSEDDEEESFAKECSDSEGGEVSATERSDSDDEVSDSDGSYSDEDESVIERSDSECVAERSHLGAYDHDARRANSGFATDRSNWDEHDRATEEGSGSECASERSDRGKDEHATGRGDSELTTGRSNWHDQDCITKGSNSECASERSDWDEQESTSERSDYEEDNDSRTALTGLSGASQGYGVSSFNRGGKSDGDNDFGEEYDDHVKCKEGGEYPTVVAPVSEEAERERLKKEETKARIRQRMAAKSRKADFAD